MIRQGLNLDLSNTVAPMRFASWMMRSELLVLDVQFFLGSEQVGRWREEPLGNERGQYGREDDGGD